MKAGWKTAVVAPAVLALGLASATASATLISFTGTGTNGSGEPLSVQADFTTTNGELTVTLTNLLAASDIISVGQALSDISFSLSDDVGTVGTLSATGQFGNVDGSGNVTLVATDASTGDTSPTRFLTSPNTSISGTSITLEAIGGGQPSQLILPSALSFPNANGSITGGQFNSFVIGPATFTLQLSGVTDTTTISDVVFSFGTQIGETTVPGVPVPTPGVPEPGVLALLGLGLIALVASRRKFR